MMESMSESESNHWPDWVVLIATILLSLTAILVAIPLAIEARRSVQRATRTQNALPQPGLVGGPPAAAPDSAELPVAEAERP